MSQSNRLITISISHYCEKTRWALKWLQIPFIEECHMPHEVYQFKTFTGDEFILSPTFSELKLTAAEIPEAND